QHEYVGLIRASGQHLLSVVNTILDMSRLETGNYAIAPKRFDIAEVVEMSKSMVDQAARERGIAFDIDIDADCTELLADRRAVQQIIINLLSNAVKFTGEGGRVRVSTGRYANWSRIAVSDTGIGMDAGFLEKVGTPFLQADNDYTRRHEGTGLGLSVVRGLVDLHGGTMQVESVPFEGTTVTVSFPADGPVVAYGGA
ncbi:MAG: HAMP domain-containing histidine kinase, partial [Cephaloticoccus sp.]|nr:HAMP domain-containing histidine kinase [Cephaloticoccus sp.]